MRIFVVCVILSFFDISGDTDLIYQDRALPSVPSFIIETVYCLISSTMEDYTCPVCAKCFSSMKSLNSHLKMAKSCSHYGKGKRKQISLGFECSEIGQMDITSSLPGVSQEDLARLQEDEDEDPQDVIQQLLYERPHDLFHFVDDVGEGEAGPGPSTTSRQRHQRITDRLLNEEADMRFEVIEEDAGKIIRMDNHFHQRWHKLFSNGDGTGNEDKDGDSVMAEPIGGGSVNPYTPFGSELDWRIARWIIKDNVGHKSLDRLLAIPGVSTIIVIAHYHY